MGLPVETLEESVESLSTALGNQLRLLIVITSLSVYSYNDFASSFLPSPPPPPPPPPSVCSVLEMHMHRMESPVKITR